MELLVDRKVFTSISTIGILYIDDVRECFTLEDTVREVPNTKVMDWKVPYKTAIPAGTYPVVIDYSPKYGKDMIHILDVPGFAGIRIHSGNVPEDTDGCILVGTTTGRDKIFNSRQAMESLFTKVKIALDNKESVYITIQ